MACGCGKKNTRVWTPRARQPQAELAPEGASHRIVSPAERQAEQRAGQRRDPRSPDSPS